MRLRPLQFWRASMRGKVMKCLSHCLLASALFAAGMARAQGEAGDANPVTHAPPASSIGAPPAETGKPRTNPSMFAPASAANSRPMSAQQREERQFLRDAAATGRFQSDASRLALSKSSNPGVRSFATTLIDHHSASNNELLHLLHARGMAPPMLANDKRKTLNLLGRLQGSKFDRAYMAEVAVKDQHQDVQNFERASANARDPQLKAWIDRMLPTLRYHLTTGAQAPLNLRLVKAAASGNEPVNAAASSPLGLSRPIAAWAIGSNTR